MIPSDTKRYQTLLYLGNGACYYYDAGNLLTPASLTYVVRKHITNAGGISHLRLPMEVLTMTAVKDYTVHIDNKKRVTLRGALYQYYYNEN